ncbi:MAG: hypothetical protein AAGI23_10630 [Bacteroidota bacterium]
MKKDSKKEKAEIVCNHLKSVFQTYTDNDLDLPKEELEEAIFKTLDLIELSVSITDLFTTKFSLAEAELLHQLAHEKIEKSEDSE